MSACASLRAEIHVPRVSPECSVPEGRPRRGNSSCCTERRLVCVSLHVRWRHSDAWSVCDFNRAHEIPAASLQRSTSLYARQYKSREFLFKLRFSVVATAPVARDSSGKIAEPGWSRANGAVATTLNLELQPAEQQSSQRADICPRTAVHFGLRGQG